MMSAIRNSIFYLLAASLILSCDSGDGVYPINPGTSAYYVSQTYTYPAEALRYEIIHVATPETDTGNLELTYSLDFTNAAPPGKEVYFVFTNASQLDTITSPVLAQLFELTPEQKYAAAKEQARNLIEWARANGEPLKGRPDITLFNSNPQLYTGREFMKSPAASLAFNAPPEPLKDTEGQTGVFYTDIDTSVTVYATCQKVISDGTKTLNIWVEDASWDDSGANSCQKKYCITQAMVDELGNKFLATGSDNDIYDWVTNIYGAEWGTHRYPSLLIAPDNQITILLMDIDGDGAGDNGGNGGVVGYFWAKDNYSNDENMGGVTGSNQRVMFYVDAVMYANPFGGTDSFWEASDYWPEVIYSTLVHEFQHMIHFYQKYVLNAPASTEVWINEMCSEVTEDLLAAKLGLSGPRGIESGTAGASYIYHGRMPRFNRFNYVPLSDWLGGEDGNITGSGDDNVLNSYSVNYAFGAYLARNFGGAELFSNIVQNGQSDYKAIETALNNTNSTSESFTSILQKWGVAVLLSDDPSSDVPIGYRYNQGGYISSYLNTVTYELGSINLFNYEYINGLGIPEQAGPRIYESLPPSDAMAGRYKFSNLYYKFGEGLNGIHTRTISLKKGMKLTVVVK